MSPLAPRIAAAAQAFDHRLPNVHGMQAIKLQKAESAALIDGYEGRTADMKRLLADMVDSLSPENADLCPYCSLDQNPDLDHFLPKARFPEFSLHARNLIPICTPCNRKKGRRVKTALGDRAFLNPIFEPSIDSPIIEAAISYQGRKISVTYTFNDRGLLPAEERPIAERHFEKLGLAIRYRKRAHGFLASLKHSTSGMAVAVKAEVLRSKIANAQYGKPVNDWEPALTRAIQPNVPAMLAWLSRR
ncbi:MAG TPA: HNH endonuclease [Caulobacteraceae bacterium]|jgi:hypothetical protein